MKERGYTLICILWFSGLMLGLTLASLGVLEGVRGRITAQKFERNAAAMAVSGADYAACMVRSARWKNEQHFRSPDIDGGRFTVKARPTGGRTWHIVSEGEVSRFKYRLERVIQ